MGLDEALVAIGDEDAMAAMFWPWLLCALDDWGRASSNPRTIKAQVVPSFAAITPDHIAGWIALYERHGLVRVYGSALAVSGDSWRRYQTQIPNSKRERDGSRFPLPPTRASSSENALDRASSSENALELARPLSPPLPSPLPPPLFPPPTPPPIIPPPSPLPSPPLSPLSQSSLALRLSRARPSLKLRPSRKSKR